MRRCQQLPDHGRAVAIQHHTVPKVLFYRPRLHLACWSSSVSGSLGLAYHSAKGLAHHFDKVWIPGVGFGRHAAAADRRQGRRCVFAPLEGKAGIGLMLGEFDQLQRRCGLKPSAPVSARNMPVRSGPSMVRSNQRGKLAVWRNASASAMAADEARFIERICGCIGMRSRA